MRENPYNKPAFQKPAPKKQIAHVEVKATDTNIKDTYIVICFEDDTEEVLFTKAKRSAISDYGSQIKDGKLEYSVVSRNYLKR